MEGQALIIFALFSLVLVGSMALSVDAGYIMAERRQVQSAADAAALAGAKAVMDNKSSSEILGAAQEYGAFNASVPASNVTVSRPPSSGSHAGDNKYVQVTVTKDVQRFFLGAIYTGSWSVSATSVAGVETEGLNATILALNSSAGGLNTSGSTYLEAIGGSIHSNYEIRTSGSTVLKASEKVSANDGIKTSGSTTITSGAGTVPNGPEIPDPLLTLLSPPSLPSAPGNPVATVSPTSYRFTGGAGISIGGGNTGQIVMNAGGTYNFVGGSGISIGGSTPTFTMQSGSYSFTGGAGININGTAPGNTIGGGTLYFGGGGGIVTGGSNHITLGPGTYIFDGGSGFSMSGSARLTFTSGAYTFYFLNGADWSFSGSSYIQTNSNVYVRAYFYGAGNNPSNLQMSGSTNFQIPTGEYYFDNG
ncbi:MAG: hypothetical protein DCC58_09530, partial [Chloroflexi bacterium]